MTPAERSAKWRRENPEKYLAQRKASASKRNAQAKKWYADNKQRKLEYNARRQREKYGVDVQFTLAHLLRSRTRIAVAKGKKAGSAVKDLGCSLQELKLHLESKFQDGMSWDNMGEWHIDHIKPLCLFDLTKRNEFLQAAHYTNLQPLWAEENLRKGANAC